MLVTFVSVDIGYESYAAGIVFKCSIVEASIVLGTKHLVQFKRGLIMAAI